jgi:CheY-like chemotaxis protein
MAIKILIVDDEPANIELLEALLEPEGYTLIKAKNGEEALEYLSANELDLVLLDVMMPGISGFSVLKEIRQNEKNKAVPVMLLTSLTDREDKLKGLGAGADDYIFKPFDRAELVFKVKTQAGLSLLRRQINEKEQLAGVMDLVLEGAILTDCSYNIIQMNRTAMDMFGLKSPIGSFEDILLKKCGFILETRFRKGKFTVGIPSTATSPRLYLSAEYYKTGQSSSGKCSYVFVMKDVTADYSGNKIKMDFLNLISAKLKGPLSVISGYSTMLSVFESDDKLKEVIAAIIRNSELMDNLMKRMLFFVEIENISLTGTDITFDAAETADRFMLVYKKSCELSGAGNTADMPYWKALAAEELIGNAIKFNDKEKTMLKVSFEGDGLTVEDNGPGIPEKDLEKAFEPFYQVPGYPPGITSGAGIGLAIVKSLAESAGMKVRLANTAKGGLKVEINRFKQ